MHNILLGVSAAVFISTVPFCVYFWLVYPKEMIDRLMLKHGSMDGVVLILHQAFMLLSMAYLLSVFL